MKGFTVGSVIRASAWGALLGGMAGFALGLMVAPEEGERLRRRFSYRLEQLGARVSHLVDDVLNPTAHSEARRTGDALVADARDRAERIREDIDTLLGEIRRGTPPTSVNG